MWHECVYKAGVLLKFCMQKILHSLAFIINTCFNFYKTKQWMRAQAVNKCVSALATMMYVTIQISGNPAQDFIYCWWKCTGNNVDWGGGDNVFYSWIYSLLLVVLLCSLYLVVSIEIKKGSITFQRILLHTIVDIESVEEKKNKLCSFLGLQVGNTF